MFFIKVGSFFLTFLFLINFNYVYTIIYINYKKSLNFKKGTFHFRYIDYETFVSLKKYTCYEKKKVSTHKVFKLLN